VDGDREIIYGLEVNENGIGRNYPKNGSLDLYGVTFGSEVDPQTVNAQKAGEQPVWHVEFTPNANNSEISSSSEIPDLMFSNNIRGASVSDGKVSMRFKHALSLLKFNVVWEEQTEGSKENYDLEKVQVRKIEMLDLHKEGDFDMVSGAWSYAENSNVYSRTYYENATGLSKPEKSYSYFFNDSVRVFPNQEGEAIRIRVTLYDGNTDKECEVVREYKLTNNGEDLVLESNYVYQITIMLLTNDVRIMVLLPTVYEWNDVSLAEEDVYLGQPVTFGGLMWMDRNLGAKTADAENDFYNSIGYYYQFGRNIPYIMDVDKFVYYVHDTNESSFDEISVVMETSATGKNAQNPYYYWYDYKKTDEIKEKLREYQVDCFYTFDHLGKRVTGSRIVEDGDPIAMINPGDVYLDENGKVNDKQTHELYKMSGFQTSTTPTAMYGSWYADMDYVKSLWQDVSNHPCPKGWRLPTADDLYAFMPRCNLSGRNYVVWDKSNVDKSIVHYWDYTGSETEDLTKAIYIQGQLGWYRKDTKDGNVQEIRFGKKTTTVNGVSASYNVIYMIKNQGTERAYRIRIMNHFTKAYKSEFVDEATFDPSDFSTNKRYITISRYTCDKDKTIDDYTQNGADETMWDNPIETLVYPCAGFIITDNYWHLSAFGSGIVLRTSEAGTTEMGSWVQYMSTTVYNVGVISVSRQSLGDQVRCVRDITAQ
jgi:hypothetical protein